MRGYPHHERSPGIEKALKCVNGVLPFSSTHLQPCQIVGEGGVRVESIRIRNDRDTEKPSAIPSTTFRDGHQ